MAKGNKPGTSRSATADAGKGKAADKTASPVPLVSSPIGGRKITRKTAKESAVKRGNPSPDGSSRPRRRFRPANVQRSAPGTSGVPAMDAQDDVKGMLAAVKEDPQASEEEVIVLSSQQPLAYRVRQGQTGSDRVRQSDI